MSRLKDKYINEFAERPLKSRTRGTATLMNLSKNSYILSPEFFVAVVKPGRVIFEVAGVPENVARDALRLASYKLPFKTKIVKKGEEDVVNEG